MNIASYALNNKKLVFLILALILIVGISSFNMLGKKEDAPFVIKTALLITQYPGATPEEVEELVTEVIEREVQPAPGIEFIKSESSFGLSIIYVNLYQYYKNDDMPQKWDELRQKVKNAQALLPPGASEIAINHDFGDVYGLYFALTAEEGFSDADLGNYANYVKKILVPVKNVQKVALFGEQYEVVNLEIRQERLANLGIHPQRIQSALISQNQLVNTGDIIVDDAQIKIRAEGDFRSMEDIENVIIQNMEGKQFRLGEIAEISKGYLDPPLTQMRMNGKKAIGIGVSTPLEADIVKVGKEVSKELDKLKAQLPVGIEIEGIYFEDEIAYEANNEFIINLIISVLIVVVTILLAMGLRAGLLIGSSIIFSILGTFVVMLIIGEALHRTSLAALIIAMGMLVDNAIVVTDNALVSIKRGVPRKKALIEGATVPQWGLFGATIIAVGSFLPLYLAPANAAEVIKPLFMVLAISLMLSWLFALTQTTVFGNFILKENTKGENKDPFNSKFYRGFRRFIANVIDRRYLTISIVVGLFFVSLIAFKGVNRSFFPSLNKPYFKVDLWQPEGVNIFKTRADVISIEEYILEDDRVKNVSITIGASPLRYYLASTSFGPRTNFANILVETHDEEDAITVMNELGNYILGNFPDATPILHPFMVSPQPDMAIEATFTGPDARVLRQLSEEAKQIMRDEATARNVKDSWGEKIPVLNPLYSQSRGQLNSVTKENMATSLKILTNGIPVGNYREKDKFMPILMLDKNRSEFNFNNLGSFPVLSSTGEPVSLNQIIEGHRVEWYDPVIKRYNRERSLAAQCEPVSGVEIPTLEAKIFPLIEQIELPEGYTLRYEGVKYYQDYTQNAISKYLPLTLLVFIIILTMLYNSYKKPLIILLSVPLMIIGIVISLYVTGAPFGFFATLGILGLIGMVIKNAIVLMDQLNLELKNGVDPYNAIILAAQSRVVPVSMASGTTILGMLPLLNDPMFGGMAATIMGGLFAATLLTIIVIPVLYTIFYKVVKVN